MPILGKLDKNGNITYAPAIYRSEYNIIPNFDKNYQLMIDMGYKPVVEDSTNFAGYITTKYIEEINNTIFIRYKIDNSEKVVNQLKTEKIAQTKVNLANYLEQNPLTSTIKYGTERQYTVTLDKQNQLTSTILDYLSKALFAFITKPMSMRQNIIQYLDGLNFPLTWNSKGDTCTNWKYSELCQLKNEINEYVAPIVEYQRKLEKQITECTTQEELKLIDINFIKERIK